MSLEYNEHFPNTIKKYTQIVQFTKGDKLVSQTRDCNNKWEILLHGKFLPSFFINSDANLTRT